MPQGQSALPEHKDAVHAYKTMLRGVLDSRPSGTRQRLANALGKNRSFVSQISNPGYLTPIPARHLEQIFEVCHFSNAEREAFLNAYEQAHPRRLHLAARRRNFRAHVIYLPDLGEPERNRSLDRLVNGFVRDLVTLLDR